MGRLLAALLLGLLTVSAARADGVYTDSAGTQHRWRIQNNHTLLWNDAPFVPVGGLFQVKSWSPGASEADLAEDLEAITKIAAANVLDVYVQPVGNGITRANPVYVQRVFDALDEQGMTYGVSLSDGPRTALVGYHILPSRYRQQIGDEGGLVRFAVPDMASAYYALTVMDSRGSSSGQILADGEAGWVDEGARVSVPAGPGPFAVVLYPERIFSPTKSALPNVWEGLDDYRDRLLELFAKVKPGKGLRFFTDPLPHGFDLSGEARQIVPSSREFAAEWGAFLARRYRTPDELTRAWKLRETEEMTFADAAQLVPLFFNEKGFHAFWHRTSGKRIPAQLAQTFWNDLDDFKVDSYRAALNDLSLALKRGVANVPVVCRARGYSKLLSYAVDARRPDLRRFEFDGVGMDAYGRGEAAARYGGADIYTQVADAPKPLWLPVLATQEARLPESSSPGFTSRDTLHALLDSLRAVGARGFYVDGVRVADPERKPYDLSAIPLQLGWLPEYRATLASTGIAAAPPPQRSAIFYPRQISGLAPMPLEGGAWWLPTDSRSSSQYRVYHFGSAGRCYSMDDGNGAVYYLFNPSGPRQITLRLPRARVPGAAEVYWLPAERGVRKKDTLTLTLGPEPIRLYNFAPGLPLPEEAFTELNNDARRLLALMKEGKRGELTLYDARYIRLKAGWRPENPDIALNTIQGLHRLCEEMRSLLQPYAWVEAEGTFAEDGTAVNPALYTFDEVEVRPGASGGRALLVGKRPATGQSAAASYELRVATEDTYRLWIAASPGASFALRINGQPWGDDNRVPRATGKTYASPPLVWFDAGTMLLPRGTHKIELRAEGPMAFDALMLAPGNYAPNGANRPPFLSSELPKGR